MNSLDAAVRQKLIVLSILEIKTIFLKVPLIIISASFLQGQTEKTSTQFYVVPKRILPTSSLFLH